MAEDGNPEDVFTILISKVDSCGLEVIFIVRSCKFCSYVMLEIVRSTVPCVAVCGTGEFSFLLQQPTTTLATTKRTPFADEIPS